MTPRSAHWPNADRRAFCWRCPADGTTDEQAAIRRLMDAPDGEVRESRRTEDRIRLAAWLADVLADRMRRSPAGVVDGAYINRMTRELTEDLRPLLMT